MFHRIIQILAVMYLLFPIVLIALLGDIDTVVKTIMIGISLLSVAAVSYAIIFRPKEKK